MKTKTFLKICIGFFGFILPASASELFYIDDYWGSLQRLDTVTLAHELMIHGNDIPNNISSGPAAVGFRSPNTLFISPDGASNHDSALHHYEFDGENFTRISTRHSFTNAWRLNGGARGPNGRVYFAARYGDRLWSFGQDIRAENPDGTSRNIGPGERLEALTGAYPRHVAYSWLDGRIAVSHNTGVNLYRSDGDSVIFERTLEFAGINNIRGVAFDVDGLVVADDDGNEIGRKSLLYISDMNTRSVLRFDATTGEPYGSNEEDPTDPTFIATGTGGIVDVGNLAVDPSDGHLYICYANGNYRDGWNTPRWVIGRFSRTGNVLNDNLAFTSPIRSMAFRPTVQQLEIEQDGEYVMGPDGFAVKPDSAGLWLKSGMAVQQALVNFFGVDFVGELVVGGTESGGIVARLNDGQSLNTIKVEINKNGSIETETNTQLFVEEGARIDGGQLQAGPGSNIEVGPGSIVDGGMASIISTGGGNIISTGGGNIISTGGGNIISTGGGNIISTGGGNIIATGGGNIIAAGGGNIISAGGGNMQLGAAGSLIGQAGGNLRAGNSPGVFTLIGGSALLHEESVIEIEIGGRTQGEEYDFYDFQNDLAGSVEINGNLVVLLVDGFAQGVLDNDSFTVIRAQTPILGEIGNLTPDGRVACADGSGSFRVTFTDDGKAVVLDDFQPGSLRDSWMATYFSPEELADPSISNDWADPDFDGLANLAEFAFNLNPMAADAAKGTRLSSSPQGSHFIYRRRTAGIGTAVDYSAAGIRYELLESDDLANWQIASLSGDVIEVLADGETETVTIPLTAALESSPLRFYRVRLTPQ